ncbi:sensor histidine kinase [Streptomyces sp. NPDC059564]|uniref:sensor histidine kinase n=1 Tax=Streptomyces sp. NPDC059564 TaxID=3346865 RepID=UPI0036B1FDE4
MNTTALYAPPTTARRRSPALLDWGGAALYVFTALLLIGGAPDAAGPLLAGVLTLALSLLTGLLRRRPGAALALTLVVSTVLAFGTQQGPRTPDGYLVYVPVALVFGVLVATRPRRDAVIAAIAVALVELPAVAGLASGPYGMTSSLLVTVLGTAASGMAGLLLRQRREHAVELRESEVSEALTAERLRIARELHDMVAHSIGVIAIQAGVGSRVIETRPAEARKALTAIETTSRETLAGLRRTLVALRRAQPDGEGGHVPTGPAPGLADLDALAASLAGAGVRVDVHTTGEARRLPPDIDLSVYRIVQEALTNVVRHAGPAAHARVTLDFAPDELRVEVVDDGRGVSARAGRTGFGITGMYERVALLHGRLSAGQRPEGGFRVAAELPLPGTDAEDGR